MSELGDLYPFLDGAREPRDATALLAEVRASTLRKAREVGELRRATWEGSSGALARAAELLAEAARRGRKVLSFGNGGSATDARDLTEDLSAPSRPDWRPIAALDLTRDAGVVTAVANDVGFESTFVRQVIAYGEPGDVAVGFSTSGESANVLAAFRTARERGLRTVGFAGYDGGRMAELAERGELDAVVVAPSSDIPRIQEAHATAYHALIAMTQRLLAGDALGPESAARTGDDA